MALLAGKKKIRIDRRSLPPFVLIAHAVNSKMQMRTLRIRVAGGTYPPH